MLVLWHNTFQNGDADPNVIWNGDAMTRIGGFKNNVFSTFYVIDSVYILQNPDIGSYSIGLDGGGTFFVASYSGVASTNPAVYYDIAYTSPPTSITETIADKAWLIGWHLADANPSVTTGTEDAEETEFGGYWNAAHNKNESGSSASTTVAWSSLDPAATAHFEIRSS